MAVVLTTVATIPPGNGHSKRNKLYYDMSKRVCWKYISYFKGNQDYCPTLGLVLEDMEAHQAPKGS